jgi:hypothetical protein
MICVIQVSCPGIHEDGEELIIVGAPTAHPTVGEGEAAVRISRKLVLEWIAEHGSAPSDDPAAMEEPEFP